jgi:hypothetical protein
MHAIFAARHLATENKPDTHASIMILRCLFYLMTLRLLENTINRVGDIYYSATPRTIVGTKEISSL